MNKVCWNLIWDLELWVRWLGELLVELRGLQCEMWPCARQPSDPGLHDWEAWKSSMSWEPESARINQNEEP